jgi:hypothetical protein
MEYLIYLFFSFSFKLINVSQPMSISLTKKTQGVFLIGGKVKG